VPAVQKQPSGSMAKTATASQWRQVLWTAAMLVSQSYRSSQAVSFPARSSERIKLDRYQGIMGSWGRDGAFSEHAAFD